MPVGRRLRALEPRRASLRNNTMNADKTNYDLLYNPRLVVKNYQEIFDRLGEHSERARATLDCYLDVPYGSGEAEKKGIFRPPGKNPGPFRYIPRGDWRPPDKKHLSFFAPPPAQPGTT